MPRTRWMALAAVTALVQTASVFTLVTSVSAATLSLVETGGVTYRTSGVADAVDGFTMSGMKVTATYQDANGARFTFTRIWEALFVPTSDAGFVRFPGDADGVFGALWRISVFGETSVDGTWMLWFNPTNFNDPTLEHRLLSVSFNAPDPVRGFTPGSVVFDRGFGGADGTLGSGVGKDFALFSGWGRDGQVTALYSNPVQLGDAPPAGDLFAGLTLLFGDGTFANGLPESTGYRFTLDTDLVTTLQVVPQPVSEPASLILLASGLLALARRRKPSPSKR